jgi:hypothetical protein
MPEIIQMTEAEWKAKGRELFGENGEDWEFVCPLCKHVAKVRDWRKAGAPDGAIAFSCVGRWAGAKREAFGKGPGPCDYAGGGLFGFNPVLVIPEGGEGYRVFAFNEVKDDGSSRRPVSASVEG